MMNPATFMAAQAGGGGGAAPAASPGLFGSGGGFSRGFSRMSNFVERDPTANPLDVLHQGMPTGYQDSNIGQLLLYLLKNISVQTDKFSFNAGGRQASGDGGDLDAMLKKLLEDSGGTENREYAARQMPVTTIGGPGGGSAFQPSPPTPGPLSMRPSSAGAPQTGLGKFF